MPRPVPLPRRDALHPGAVWVWALGLAIAATRTDNWLLLALILAVVAVVVAARRDDSPWAGSFGAFLRLGLLVVVIRVVLQAVLSSDTQGSHVLITLPLIPLPAWMAGVKLGGDITAEAVVDAVTDGGRLAVAICCIGAANALASPRRLLRGLPAALYEVGVACVVGLTFAPQLIADAQRVRLARRLRGHRGRGPVGFGRTAIPVLHSALERSVALAAAMESRGFGWRPVVAAGTDDAVRTEGVGRRRGRAVVGVLGLAVTVVGVFLVLSPATGLSTAAAAGIAAAGILLAVLASLDARRSAVRTVYRRRPWGVRGWLAAGSGAVTAVVFAATAYAGVGGMTLAAPLELPQVPVLPVLAALLALLPVALGLPRRSPRTSDGSQDETRPSARTAQRVRTGTP